MKLLMLRALRAVRRRRGEDAGSLPLAMLLTLVGTSLSTLIVPVLIGQLRDTAETIDRAKALHAAQAGIDVVIGRVRASGGFFTQLSCSPLIGLVGAGLPGRYQVVVQFQDVKNVPIACTNQRPNAVPAYAVITSSGTGQGINASAPMPSGVNGAATRTLTATYVFRLTNANIEGGLLRLYGGVYCFDAGSGSPASGTNLQVQLCNGGSTRQTFAYTKYLTLVLVSSKTAKNPEGMCLDSGTTVTTGTLIQFQPCSSPTVQYQQRWSLDDSSDFAATDPDGSTVSKSHCFHVKAADTPGSFVEVNSCGGAADDTRTFAPEASVGAGAAGPPAQLVDFQQFGRCIDVTNFNPSLGFLIVWPCKQAPNQADVGWNQRWTVPTTADGTGSVTGPITTFDGTTTWCLKNSGLASAPELMSIEPCPASPPTSMQWTVYYKTDSYGSSYVIKDTNGQCLQPADLNSSATPSSWIFQGSTTVGKLILAACDGSKLQKWNAPANTEDPSPLKNLGEK